MVSGVFDRNSDQALAREINAEFERTADGKLIFYLDTNHHVGYVIDPPEREQALRNYALQRGKIGKLIAGFATAIIGFFGYTVFPRYPWWQGLAYCVGTLAVLLFASWLWKRSATFGLTKIGKMPAPAPKAWVAWTIIAATLIFICVYPPSAELSSAIAFYPDIGKPILGVIFTAGMTYFLIHNAAGTKQKIGTTHYRIAVAFFGLLAIFELTTTGSRLTHPVPQLIVTPSMLFCGNDRIDWRDVSSVSRVPGSRWHEYARLTYDPAHVNATRLPAAASADGSFSCEIGGTGAGYLAVYDAIEAAWKKQHI